MPQTLLVALAHPDDEMGCAGTILAQRARGDRVVLLWLTRGEMTEAFGPLAPREVARRRTEQGARAAEILGAEPSFLDLPDTRVRFDPDAVEAVARVIADVRPDGVLTWGEAWHRGMRHPDHQACGRIVRAAITIARIQKRMAPRSAHRADCPVFTYRDEFSTLPTVTVDVAPHREGIHALADFYRQEIGFGERDWIDDRLRRSAEPRGLEFAETFDAWETAAGVTDALLPAPLAGWPAHPTREDRQERS